MDIISYAMAKKYSNMVASGLASATVDDANKSITFTLVANGYQYPIHFNQPNDKQKKKKKSGISEKENGDTPHPFSHFSQSHPF